MRREEERRDEAKRRGEEIGREGKEGKGKESKRSEELWLSYIFHGFLDRLTLDPLQPCAVETQFYIFGVALDKVQLLHTFW